VSNRPRVIFVNRVYWPSTAATAQLLADLTAGLAAAGWEVHVIAAGMGPDHYEGVAIHRTGGDERHDGLASQALNYLRFLRAARQQVGRLVEPGDVVVPLTDPPLLAGLFSGDDVTRRGGMVVHWLQDVYPEILSAHAGSWLTAPLAPVKAWRNRAWRRAARCVPVGEEMAALVAAAGVPVERIRISPNWAPRELDRPAEAGAIALRRAAWGVEDKFVVAYSGNLGRVHEFAAVIDAAARLRERTDIVFLCIGTGPRFAEVQAAAQSRGLGNVRFLPPETRENLPAALAAADVHLVTLKPAFHQLVYPSKLAGVLAAGRPVLFVGPVEGEIARLLMREDCGLACAPHDGAHLARAIAGCAADPARRAQLGRNGRAAYVKMFSFDAALARWQEILREASACG
jgi:colanic acid biosynthesis glycosyl transferase WcaI